MIFLGLEPQWYITQRIVFTTRSLTRCWKPSVPYSLKLFSLDCAINIRHISSYKMISVSFEPQWHIRQHVVFTSTPLARSLLRLIHLYLLSLTCAINIRHISSHKMILVELEPQWYITQRVVFTNRQLARSWKPSVTYSPIVAIPFFTRPLARCWKPGATYSPFLLFSNLCN